MPSFQVFVIAKHLPNQHIYNYDLYGNLQKKLSQTKGSERYK